MAEKWIVVSLGLPRAELDAPTGKLVTQTLPKDLQQPIEEELRGRLNNSDGGLPRLVTGLALVGLSLFACWFWLPEAPVRSTDEPAIESLHAAAQPSWCRAVCAMPEGVLTALR